MSEVVKKLLISLGESRWKKVGYIHKKPEQIEEKDFADTTQ